MRSLKRFSLVLACCFSSLAWSQENAGSLGLAEVAPKSGPVKAEAPQFMRYVENAGRPQALEVAVVHYESPSVAGAEVDLVGAVHIGEQTYYDQLNQLFDKYDVVLYELVAEEGTVIPKGGKREGTQHPVAMLQDSARSFLALKSQLAEVDYTKKHFVRADMTPQQISDKMSERGDTALTVALSTFVDVMRQQNLAARQGSGAQPLLDANLNLTELLTDSLKAKQVLARQLATTGSLDQALGGALNQMLVKDRNAAATKVLQQQLTAGKKRIAIFYGAAHMNDFHTRLVSDFGMRPTSTRWLKAWDLTRSGASPLDNPAALLQQLLDGFLLFAR